MEESITFSLSDDDEICAPTVSSSLHNRNPDTLAVPPKAVTDNMCAAPARTKICLVINYCINKPVDNSIYRVTDSQDIRSI